MSTVAVTDESFEQRRAEGRQARCWWTSGRSGAAPASRSPRRWSRSPSELAGHVTIAKLNIEDSPTTPSRYGVRGIPTMMLFKDGHMASMKVGAMPKQKILEWLAETGVAAAAA